MTVRYPAHNGVERYRFYTRTLGIIRRMDVFVGVGGLSRMDAAVRRREILEAHWFASVDPNVIFAGLKVTFFRSLEIIAKQIGVSFTWFTTSNGKVIRRSGIELDSECEFECRMQPELR